MFGCGAHQITELKRNRAKETKPSPSHTRTKKVDSPSTARKISDSSPRSMRRVGSGEKGTPTGSPAEMRLVLDSIHDKIRLYCGICQCACT